MAEEDPATFDIFVAWLLSGYLPFFDRFHHGDFELGTSHPSFVRLCKVYIFFDKLGMKGLSGRTLNWILTSTTNPLDDLGGMPKDEDLRFIYDNTSEDSDLRKYLVRFALETIILLYRDTDFKGTVETVCSSRIELNRNLMKALRKHIMLSKKDCEEKYCQIHHRMD